MQRFKVVSAVLDPLLGTAHFGGSHQLHGLGAVSYTHLDVYKRQREDRPVYCSDCFARMKQN